MMNAIDFYLAIKKGRYAVFIATTRGEGGRGEGGGGGKKLQSCFGNRQSGKGGGGAGIGVGNRHESTK